MVSRPPDDRDVAGRLALAAFQPSSAVERRRGWDITFLRFCCSKWWKGRTPRACSNHVFAIQCNRPRANHSRSGCDHARVVRSTVVWVRESERERAIDPQTSQADVRQEACQVNECAPRCREEASAALHDKISSEDTVSTLELARPLDPWGLSVTGPGFDLSLAHCETPGAQAWSTDFLGQTARRDGDQGRDSVPERQN